VAALRGHRVALYEKGAELGGQVLIAARAPLRPAWGQSVEWLARQLAMTSAIVHLGTEATVDVILAEQPDAVVIATGAVPRRPDLPGSDLPGVGTVEELLLGSLDVGQRCVVVDSTGQAQAGLAADFLARQGRDVSVITPYHTVCDALEPSTKEPLYEKLYQGGVVMMPNTNLLAIEQAGETGTLRLTIQNEYSRRADVLNDVDTVVLAWGGRAVDSLYHALKGSIPRLELVGDAMAPRRMHDAMLEGTRAGRRI
jgi:NADPH-dependent 2,4-dienoyl-CoA reductase/sulfur reductase-like enzyme